MKVDPISFAQQLIQCPSITPHEGGAISLLTETLKTLGFEIHKLRFEDDNSAPVENLYARLGTQGPCLCFAGHTDVVPTGEKSQWKVDPFAGEIIDGQVYGRGAVDMKGAIACFVAALAEFIDHHNGSPPYSISMLITGDEEGPAINGTKKVLKWLENRGEKIDACLVGEPTSQKFVGDTVKIGRRGSMGGNIQVLGTQGHVAYPEQADNPIYRLLDFLNAIKAKTLDTGTEFFAPSNLEITSIDVGNEATNIIPASATAQFNIRFNDTHTGSSLKQWMEQTAAQTAGDHKLNLHISGEAFRTNPGAMQDLVTQSIRDVTGTTPTISTSGGTSDARFIHHYCPVVELGLLNATAHQINERVAVKDLEQLTKIYAKILHQFK